MPFDRKTHSSRPCIDRAAQRLDRIAVSAGQRGIDLYLAVSDLRRVTGARWVDTRPVGTGERGESFPSSVPSTGED